MALRQWPYCQYWKFDEKHESKKKLIYDFKNDDFALRKGKITLWMFSPDSWGQQDVAVVLEIISGAVSKHDVCQDVTTKAVEHGTEPGGHGTPAGNLHRACNTEEEPSVTVLNKICYMCMCMFFLYFYITQLQSSTVKLEFHISEHSCRNKSNANLKIGSITMPYG